MDAGLTSEELRRLSPRWIIQAVERVFERREEAELLATRRTGVLLAELLNGSPYVEPEHDTRFHAWDFFPELEDRFRREQTPKDHLGALIALSIAWGTDPPEEVWEAWRQA